MQDYCATKWSTLTKRFDSKLFSKQADISRLKYQCFKSAWMFEEVQWTLGAILFKTRFLPLRDLQAETLKQAHSNWLGFVLSPTTTTSSWPASWWCYWPSCSYILRFTWDPPEGTVYRLRPWTSSGWRRGRRCWPDGLV
ncbi:hypothetical protein UPYG_G00063110 [Umbra pygmaea]|uniref:Uncharacterized protein n=1 Tax=Umbra pygmaea TaxID=75934 RepID=A0ABD0X9S2_UMBPY